ncbi:hypothetical protein PU629_20560 [Pullulanibacillus sp. KACC 23026]|nr:hypothetical protein [Pullulanibacillus sp. KACC 23026]WEG12461.1 hypothetical protein PU629_20560 [Pullulanibacillus sp. KACC 23026]
MSGIEWAEELVSHAPITVEMVNQFVFTNGSIRGWDKTKLTD